MGPVNGLPPGTPVSLRAKPCSRNARTRRSIMTCIRGEPSPQRRRSHQATPRQSANWPAPITRRPPSPLSNTPLAGEIFQKISGGRNAFGGFGHPGGDLAGPGDVLRGEDGAQVRDQRFLGSGRKAPGGAHLQSFDRSSPERLIGPTSKGSTWGLRRAGPRPWCPRHRGARPRGRPERWPRNSPRPPP